MPLSFESFVKESQATLREDDTPVGREKVRRLVEELLANSDFVDTHFGGESEPGRYKLYEDRELGFVVLAHMNGKGGKSPPHDHGSSWAIYGQVTGYTDMTVWKRTDGSAGGGKANLEAVKEYRLNPGEVGKYDVGDIHSIAFPDGARFLRVTGRDLDYEERLKYDTDTGEAIVIESASAR